MDVETRRGQAAAARAVKPVRFQGVNRSVVRALSLLLDIARADSPQSFAELQIRHQLPKATLHKLLHTLERESFLERNKGRYSLGLAAKEISASVTSPGDLANIVTPILQALVDEWNETCHLGILDGDEEVVLKRLDPTRQVVRLVTVVGRRHPAHASAGGLASLGRLSQPEIAALPEKLTQLTKNTMATREQLIVRLEEVRSKGYALDLEEAYIGVRCVGAAVTAPGWPQTHISFSLPRQRASLERLRELAKPIMAAAREIEKILAVTPRA